MINDLNLVKFKIDFLSEASPRISRLSYKVWGFQIEKPVRLHGLYKNISAL